MGFVKNFQHRTKRDLLLALVIIVIAGLWWLVRELFNFLP